MIVATSDKEKANTALMRAHPMILGINASSRVAVRNNQDILVKGVTDDLLKHIIKETGEPTEYVRLGGKTIKGCHACL